MPAPRTPSPRHLLAALPLFVGVALVHRVPAEPSNGKYTFLQGSENKNCPERKTFQLPGGSQSLDSCADVAAADAGCTEYFSYHQGECHCAKAGAAACTLANLVPDNLLKVYKLTAKKAGTFPDGQSSHSLSFPRNAQDPSKLAREYIAYVPKQRPLKGIVLLFHGYSETAEAMCSREVAKYSEQFGFVGVCPQAVSKPYDDLPGWNTGASCCGGGLKGEVDDVGYVAELIARVKAQLPSRIPDKRTFAMGFSNGCGLAERLSCELPDGLLHGVGMQGCPFSMYTGTCTPKSVWPLWYGMGTNDTFFPDTAANAKGWADHANKTLGCT